jgi:hypothetical protein
MAAPPDGRRVGFYLLPREPREPSPPGRHDLRPRLSITQEASEESSAASTPRPGWGRMGRGEEDDYGRLRDLEPRKHHCEAGAHPRTSLAHQSMFDTCPLVPDPSFRSSSPGPGEIQGLRLHRGAVIGGARSPEPQHQPSR